MKKDDDYNKRGGKEFLPWFRPGEPRRTKILALWLLIWNSTALMDAYMFTFRPADNLDGYMKGQWGLHCLAITRLLANCQLGLISTIALVGLTANERVLKIMFRLLILITLGAFRAIFVGVQEDVIKPPIETWWASLLSLPPFMFLGYFGFVY